jgi:hypothetical protein
LRAATGEFVTVHDADDWSHPQKFEIQMRRIRETGAANVTYAVRMDRGLVPRVRHTHVTTFERNTASLLLRRDEIVAMGGWDDVKVGADSELSARYSHVFGRGIEMVLPRCPLSLLLTSGSNLTDQGATRSESRLWGVRREYRESYELWHRRTFGQTSDGALPRCRGGEAAPDGGGALGARLPFPVPGLLRLGATGVARYDLVVAADYCDEGTADRALAMLSAPAARGQLCASLHIPRRAHAQKTVPDGIRERLWKAGATPLVYGDAASADTVAVVGDGILLTPPETLARVEARRGIVIPTDVGPMPGPPGRAAAEERFRELFGIVPEWGDLG